MEIRHLQHTEINFEKWDACLLQASNSLIYAESWYLNIVSPAWEALIAGDYEYVMPLPLKRKFGIPFLAQPPLTQQLGVFSKNKITEKIVRDFILKIPYLSYHLHLNEENECPESKALPNYVLDLNKNYVVLYSDFSKNTKRNIEKANKSEIEITNGLTPDEFLDFYYQTEKNYAEPTEKIAAELIKTGFETEKLRLYGAYNMEKKLISALCLLHSAERLIYLLPVSNEEGKKTSAMFSIINEIIRTNAETPMLLDFEGSRIEGIAKFYEGFGGRNKPYFEVKHLSVNDLLKKLPFY